MAGIRDVAKLAGVGVATVSRVLNESGYVSEETRKKILDAMEELDYIPNELARQLYHKKSGIIAVLMPDVSHPFFSELVKNIETMLYEHGYKTMLCDTFKEKNSEKEYLSMLERNIVDGIITGVHSLDVDSYRKISKPIVAFDRVLGNRIPIVRVNHKAGGHMAAQLLYESGCRNVVQFHGAKVVTSPSHERHTEFEQYMKERGVKVTSVELLWNRFDSSYFEDVTRQVLNEHPEIDGVFGADLLVAYCMKGALRHGKRIPEDLKLVAYDGTYITEIVTPEITAIVQPISQIADALVSIICDMVEGKKLKGHKVIFDVSVKYGGTTLGNITK
mgnify:CR=1 FL=1